MWRVVVRLTCIVMGGVLVVMTLGIGVRRGDELPRLLILKAHHPNSTIIYHPETKTYQSFPLQENHWNLRVAGHNWFTFVGGDGYFYRQGILVSKPRRISQYIVTQQPLLSPNEEWLIYQTGSGFGEATGLYALRIDGSQEHRLTRDIPNDFDRFLSLSFSPDGERLAFAVSNREETQFAVYAVRLDGADLRLLWSQSNVGVRYIKWHEAGVVIQSDRLPYLSDPISGETRALMFGVYLGNYAFVNWLPEARLFLIRYWANDENHLAAVRENGTIVWIFNGYDLWYLSASLGEVFTEQSPQGLSIVDSALGKPVPLLPTVEGVWHCRFGLPTNKQWVVFNAFEQATQQEALWRFDMNSNKLTRLWGTPGADIFDVWVSPDGQEILVDAATPTWAGLLRMNPDGSDVRELTNVQDIELGEHDFVDWATLPDRAWQPVALGGGGIGLLVIGLGWPIIGKLVLRRHHLA